MSRIQVEQIETQQRTIRKLHVVTERKRLAIGDALTMLRAGNVKQAVADLERGISAKRG